MQGSELLGAPCQEGVSTCLQQQLTDAGIVLLSCEIECRESHCLCVCVCEDVMYV